MSVGLQFQNDCALAVSGNATSMAAAVKTMRRAQSLEDTSDCWLSVARPNT
jgi:hypothetical protein